MPPLALHTLIAKQIADRLRLPALDDERGSLYLGSTAPDVRVITRWERERTHFFDLDCFDEQSGVHAFLQRHTELAEPGRLSVPAAAFVAGYITHLVMDEMWIGTIYRPYFGERSPLAGSLRANVMDRALQFSLDSNVRSDRDLMLHMLQAIAGHELDLDIGVIDRDTLRQWHGVIVEFVKSEPDWERFRERAKRHLRIDQTADGEYEDLALSLPELVDETLRYLSRERVEGYLHEAEEGGLRAVKEYLACA